MKARLFSLQKNDNGVDVMKILKFVTIPLLVVFFGAIMSFSAHADGSPNKDIFGKWRVVATLDSADVTALDDKQAKQLIGKSMTISKDKFEFNGRVCKAPTYERTQEDSARYFREQMHATTENLRLPATITAIDARCTFLFPKADGKVMFLWKGFFFDARRITPRGDR